MRRRIDTIRAGDGRLRLTDWLLLIGLFIMCVMVLIDFAERDDPEPALMLGLAVVLGCLLRGGRGPHRDTASRPDRPAPAPLISPLAQRECNKHSAKHAAVVTAAD